MFNLFSKDNIRTGGGSAAPGYYRVDKSEGVVRAYKAGGTLQPFMVWKIQGIDPDSGDDREGVVSTLLLPLAQDLEKQVGIGTKKGAKAEDQTDGYTGTHLCPIPASATPSLETFNRGVEFIHTIAGLSQEWAEAIENAAGDLTIYEGLQFKLEYRDSKPSKKDGKVYQEPFISAVLGDGATAEAEGEGEADADADASDNSKEIADAALNWVKAQKKSGAATMSAVRKLLPTKKGQIPADVRTEAISLINNDEWLEKAMKTK